MASQDFPNDILSGSADEAAIGLLGCLLIREFDDGGIAAARIVETEAYDQNDPASHAFHGRSERNALLEGERIAASPRIGISKAAERLRRFFIVDNPYVTKSPLNRRNTLLAG